MQSLATKKITNAVFASVANIQLVFVVQSIVVVTILILDAVEVLGGRGIDIRKVFLTLWKKDFFQENM